EADGPALLMKLRAARESYERDVARRDETSKFWKGLVNRWNKAVDTAKTFPMTAGVTPAAAAARLAGAAGGIAAMASPGLPGIGAIAVAEAPQPATLTALRIGMSGPRVLAWQTFLRGQGFDPGPLDGGFGEHTRDATEAFQTRAKLTVDGVAGRETL